jgi:hypothetical protein
MGRPDEAGGARRCHGVTGALACHVAGWQVGRLTAGARACQTVPGHASTLLGRLALRPVGTLAPSPSWDISPADCRPGFRFWRAGLSWGVGVWRTCVRRNASPLRRQEKYLPRRFAMKRRYTVRYLCQRHRCGRRGSFPSASRPRVRQRLRVWSRAKGRNRPKNLENNGPALFGGRLAGDPAGERKWLGGKEFRSRPSCRPACQVAVNFQVVGPPGISHAKTRRRKDANRETPNSLLTGSPRGLIVRHLLISRTI